MTREEKRPANSYTGRTDKTGTVRRARLHANFERGGTFRKTRYSHEGATSRGGAPGGVLVRIGGFANVA